MNAVLLHEAVIGESAIVGASSLVPERMQVPPRTLVAGVPARVRKELSEEVLRALAGSAEHYVRLKDSYLQEWIGTRG
jgi:carbonic anhydrase/acetyltransferase-like protein (isoleucine patch superfamily)